MRTFSTICNNQTDSDCVSIYMSQPISQSLCLFCSVPELQHKALNLREKLNLAACEGIASEDVFLCLEEQGLALKIREQRTLSTIQVDFVGGGLGHRRKFGGGRGQAVAKAVGLKQGQTPSVLDVNAGLGRDAFILAMLGCHVTMVERAPLIHALLEDGLQRARQDEELATWIDQRLSLRYADAIATMHELPAADVVYLDPMYPKRKKSALVKQEMRALRVLAGDDEDADQLLLRALGHAQKRVVVKRPRLAEFLMDKKPSFQIEGKTTRFDVYVK